MPTPPTNQESTSIRRAYDVLETITAAMGTEQEYELLKARTAVWQAVRQFAQGDYEVLLGMGMTISMIRDGIRKKIEIGEDNDTFHKAGLKPGFSDAYELGQKLVRWNRLMERRLLDRLLARKGPLEPMRVLIMLDDAHSAVKSWEARP